MIKFGPSILAVNGMPGAGKTSVCRWLENSGYERISAGEQTGKFMAKKRAGSPPSTGRKALQEFGLEIVRGKLEIEFADHLISAITNSNKCVFDGIRIAKTLAHMKSMLDMTCIYLDIGVDTAAWRIARRDNIEVAEAYAILRAPIEIGAASLKSICDVTVDATMSMDSIRRYILPYVLT